MCYFVGGGAGIQALETSRALLGSLKELLLLLLLYPLLSFPLALCAGLPTQVAIAPSCTVQYSSQVIQPNPEHSRKEDEECYLKYLQHHPSKGEKNRCFTFQSISRQLYLQILWSQSSFSLCNKEENFYERLIWVFIFYSFGEIRGYN